MLMPGIGESYVAPRIRLFLALTFSIILVPVASPLPPPPATVFGLISLLSSEILIGLFIGSICRLIISAVHMGAAVIAYESSLISALTPSITQAQAQDTSIGNFLSVAVVALLFATDMHHLMLRGLANSYAIFPAGELPFLSDIADHFSQTLNGAFHAAAQIAAPHLVIGTLLYLGAGMISRLLPNIQIFFIMQAPQILISFFVFLMTISAILMWYMEYFQSSLGTFLTP